MASLHSVLGKPSTLDKTPHYSGLSFVSFFHVVNQLLLSILSKRVGVFKGRIFFSGTILLSTVMLGIVSGVLAVFQFGAQHGQSFGQWETPETLTVLVRGGCFKEREHKRSSFPLG